jgi:hypothetical protein
MAFASRTKTYASAAQLPNRRSASSPSSDPHRL